MNEEIKEETNLSKEEMIKKLEEAFEGLKNQSVEIYGSKENPYYCYCHNEIYKKVKEKLLLDENDMYCYYGGWVKVINVDKHFGVEVKPYEVKDNPFCNTFKKPFYQDLFKQDKRKYSIEVAGKWRKRK